uniref:Uncharacterized protein LOC114345249 n=1 Tax=Diabrotica virgifera virgifera TaxID=50390 RepID=A0A6P7H2C8_DIAVI
MHPVSDYLISVIANILNFALYILGICLLAYIIKCCGSCCESSSNEQVGIQITTINRSTDQEETLMETCEPDVQQTPLNQQQNDKHLKSLKELERLETLEKELRGECRISIEHEDIYRRLTVLFYREKMRQLAEKNEEKKKRQCDALVSTNTLDERITSITEEEKEPNNTNKQPVDIEGQDELNEK